MERQATKMNKKWKIVFSFLKETGYGNLKEIS